MKKISIIIMLSTVLLISLTACSGNSKDKLPKTEAMLLAKVIKFYDQSMLVVGENPNDLFMVSTETNIYNEENNQVDRTSLIEGQAIEIGFSGAVLESYPMQLAGLAYIKIVDEGENWTGLYAKVIDDLWKTDEGLNTGVEIFAFDLTQATNLSASEKEALAYVVGNTYALQGMVATYEILVEQGYIDSNSLFFEKGLLFKIEVKEMTDDWFTFDVSKWRSGNGAYFFNDCTATKSGRSWTYKVGTEAIS